MRDHSGLICACSGWVAILALGLRWFFRPNPEAKILAARILRKKRAKKRGRPERWPVFLLEEEHASFDDFVPYWNDHKVGRE